MSLYTHAPRDIPYHYPTTSTIEYSSPSLYHNQQNNNNTSLSLSNYSNYHPHPTSLSLSLSSPFDFSSSPSFDLSPDFKSPMFTEKEPQRLSSHHPHSFPHSQGNISLPHHPHHPQQQQQHRRSVSLSHFSHPPRSETNMEGENEREREREGENERENLNSFGPDSFLFERPSNSNSSLSLLETDDNGFSLSLSNLAAQQHFPSLAFSGLSKASPSTHHSSSLSPNFPLHHEQELEREREREMECDATIDDSSPDSLPNTPRRRTPRKRKIEEEDEPTIPPLSLAALSASSSLSSLSSSSSSSSSSSAPSSAHTSPSTTPRTPRSKRPTGTKKRKVTVKKEPTSSTTTTTTTTTVKKTGKGGRGRRTGHDEVHNQRRKRHNEIELRRRKRMSSHFNQIFDMCRDFLEPGTYDCPKPKKNASDLPTEKDAILVMAIETLRQMTAMIENMEEE